MLEDDLPEKPMLLVLTAAGELPDAALDAYETHVRAYRRLRFDARTAMLLVDAVPRGERGPVARVSAMHGHDHAWLEAPPRRLESFALMLFDMDSTLIPIECIDELAVRKGCAQAVAALTAQAMEGREQDYDRSLRERVRLLAGLPTSELQWVRTHRVRLNPGAEALVAAAHAAGLRTGIVSGGFDVFTEALRHELGLSFAHGNRLVVEGGVLTGELEGILVNAGRKAAVLREACHLYGCEPHQAIAVGDGANDIDMMAAAGLAVGFRPKEIIAGFADIVLRTRLDGLAHLLDAGCAAWADIPRQPGVCP
ncbi:phosphoserine phosphatase SerB [Castellaniella sp. GW247-6E4]|uniref:phosphoserine phosphatase SerB n=1 Tax=Castellaniella sp. GW247-6E4 TaxID=3140380 RepID=UPI003315F0B7